MKKLMSLAAAAAIGLALVVAPVATTISGSTAYAAVKKDKKAKKAKKAKGSKAGKKDKGGKSAKARTHNPLTITGCILSLGTANYCRV